MRPYQHRVDIPFTKAATYDITKRPRLDLLPEVFNWIGERDIWWNHEWLINGKPEQQHTTWRVRFHFDDGPTALLFKLTFGGQ